MNAPRARIGFSHSTGLLGLGSRLIMWITRAPASHVFFLVWSPELGCDLVLEANDGGFVPRALVDFLRTNRIVALYLPRQSIDAAIPPYAEANMGRRYDWLGLFGMACVELGRRLGRTWRNPWEDRTALFCSEAVAAVLSSADYPGIEGHIASATDPGQLLNLLAHDGSSSLPVPAPVDLSTPTTVH